ncbi:MAG: hypothetical protein J7K40_05585, partial [candidate division Zixibacteria bacterium]|nr:hypothetical protein [candidate division Zixibacteria bacterium]
RDWSCRYLLPAGARLSADRHEILCKAKSRIAMFAEVVQCLVVLWIANQASFACWIIFKELYEKGRTVVNLYID